jgi:hypothetical protein
MQFIFLVVRHNPSSQILGLLSMCVHGGLLLLCLEVSFPKFAIKISTGIMPFCLKVRVTSCYFMSCIVLACQSECAAMSGCLYACISSKTAGPLCFSYFSEIADSAEC